MRTNISSLKQGLSAALERVKTGEVVTVLERKTPIARIVPYKPAAETRLHIRPPTRKFVDLKISVSLKLDPTKLISDDREDKWFIT